MNLKYKFKIDSLLEFWGIPARIYFMAATLFFLDTLLSDRFPHGKG